jgi:hypothetical protein
VNCVADVTTLTPSLGVLTSNPDPVQLSNAVGVPNATAAQPLNVPLQLVTLGGKTIFGAQAVIVGTCASVIITSNGHELVLPCMSVAVAVTCVVPTGNDEPDGGAYVMPSTPQLSFAVAL